MFKFLISLFYHFEGSWFPEIEFWVNYCQNNQEGEKAFVITANADSTVQIFILGHELRENDGKFHPGQAVTHLPWPKATLSSLVIPKLVTVK